ncbi:MAG: DUF2922 domain-containing protein [Clostridium sp.]|uniref:DUF2922 domain-containing protein n=1 Tax=Clostridium sp. TaxID=1506 RepID=UPI0032167D46
MERKLVLTFKDSTEARFNLIVTKVKDNVTLAQVNAIMDLAISSQVFQSKKGQLVSKLEAVVIDTTETPYILA